MKKIFLLIFFYLAAFGKITAQQGMQLKETSIVKDTSGNIIPYIIWNQLLPTGRYSLKTEKHGKENASFIIIRLSDEEYEKKLSGLPKPGESNFFKTGNSFLHFKTKDIDDNKINTKELAGKTIVLNYWFIDCPPCQREIPELNKLAQSYKADSSIVFLAIALDQKHELKDYLRSHPFAYRIIDDGRYIADQSRINSYPTNVIIDPAGKIYFHSTGLATNTVYWLKKSIEELKKNGEKKNEPAATE